MTDTLANLCDRICAGRPVSISELIKIPKSEWTIEIATRLINKDSILISFAPEHALTMSNCTIAVHNLSKMLEYVPNKFKTRDICAYAIRHYTVCIRWAPRALMTEEFLQDVFGSFRRLDIAVIVPYVPESIFNTMIPFFAQRCDNILPHLRMQPRNLCLEYYQMSRPLYQTIRADENRRFVVRMTVSNIVAAMRNVGLSTNLLVEIFESMGSVLYPTLNDSDSPLSPTQLWSTVAAANHA